MSPESDAVFNGKSNAFPSVDSHGEGPPGMTLREWFAGQALVGLMVGVVTGKGNARDAAEVAVEAADALLIELAKPAK